MVDIKMHNCAIDGDHGDSEGIKPDTILIISKISWGLFHAYNSKDCLSRRIEKAEQIFSWLSVKLL